MRNVWSPIVAAAEKELPKRGKLRIKLSVQIVLRCSLLRVDALTTHREGPSSFFGQILSRSPLHQREVLWPDDSCSSPSRPHHRIMIKHDFLLLSMSGLETTDMRPQSSIRANLLLIPSRWKTLLRLLHTWSQVSVSYYINHSVFQKALQAQYNASRCTTL